MANLIGALKNGLFGIFRFSGRDQRRVFWPYVGFIICLYMLSFMIGMFGIIGPMVLAEPSTQSPVVDEVTSAMVTFAYLNSIIGVCVILLLAAAVSRRLHDAGIAAYFGLLPLPNFIFAMYYMPKSMSETLKAGQSDMISFSTMFINNAIYLALVTILIVLLAQPSSKKDNRHGVAPQED